MKIKYFSIPTPREKNIFKAVSFLGLVFVSQITREISATLKKNPYSFIQGIFVLDLPLFGREDKAKNKKIHNLKELTFIHFFFFFFGHNEQLARS